MYIEQLQFTIAAGETKRFETQGRYFEVIDASAAVGVVFGDQNGGQAGRLVNALSGVFMNAPFKGFELASATAQTVTLLVTDGSGGSRRQPGNVRVIDSSSDKTLAGSQFATAVTATASVGVGGVVLLGANGGGARKVAIRSLLLQSAVAGSVLIYTGSALTGTLGAPAGAFRSKYVNVGAVSTSARAQAASCAAASPSAAEIAGIATWLRVYLPANTPTAVPMSTPVVIDGNNLLVVSAEALNRDVGVLVECEEVS